MNELGNRQTELIKMMRFPLIVMVLYVHATRPAGVPMEWSLSGFNLYHIFTEVTGHYIGGLALCWFFFFSGFLFYHNKKRHFGWHWVSGKYIRRVRSILLPYLLWNALAVIAVMVVASLAGWLGISVSGDPLESIQKGPLYWFLTGPMDFPLWYLRDLIFLSILAPLFYYPVKKWPGICLIVLLAIYVASIFEVKIFPFPSFAFFGAGVWMGVRKNNLVDFCQYFRRISAIAAPILLVATVLSYNSGYDNSVFLVFAPFGMITLLNIFNWLFDKVRIRNVLLKLTETVFFVYAAHEIYILGWTKGLFLRLLGDSLWAQFVSFLFVPLVTLLVCLALFYGMKRVAPEPLSVLCGFRTVHKFE